MRHRCSIILLLLVALLAVASSISRAGADAPIKDLFDPARHMRVADVKAGMKGYGLSVFSGTKIEKFNVEVISVLEKFNPRHDVILVRCSGANLEHTGSIAGMSGSPVFLVNDKGEERLAGAFAYGWPMMKDPVGGVQPIEYMLQIPTEAPTTLPVPLEQTTGAGKNQQASKLSWRVDEAVMMPWSRSSPEHYPFASIDSTRPNPRLSADAIDTTRLRPLATPLMTSGLAPRLIETLTPVYRACGFVPLQSGGAGGSTRAPEGEVRLEPGSVLTVPLLIGDIDMTAVGTCTEVIDQQIFGFGHPFMSQGPVSLPMGAGYIQAVIANLMTSFKLGAMTSPSGAIHSDEMTGVAGRIGKVPAMVPIHLRVRYGDGSLDEQYNFKAASHARFTPLIAITAIASAITGEHELPEFHTMEYELTTLFENGQKLELKNISVNSDVGELFFEVGGPMIAAAENPFERVMVKEITGTVTVRPEAREARVLSVNVPRLKHRPGETVKAYVSYRPFRGAEATLPIAFQLPSDLSEGVYQLTISDWMQYFAEEQAAKPFRFMAESIGEVFDVMRDISSVRHDALYVRLNRQADGVAIGRTAMPNLPSSRREVLIGAGRSNTTPFVSASVKSIPTPYVMSGSAQFAITIDRNAHVEVGGARGAGGTAPRPEAPVEDEDGAEAGKSRPKPPAPAPGATPDAKPDAGGERQGEPQ